MQDGKTKNPWIITWIYFLKYNKCQNNICILFMHLSKSVHQLVTMPLVFEFSFLFLKADAVLPGAVNRSIVGEKATSQAWCLDCL